MCFLKHHSSKWVWQHGMEYFLRSSFKFWLMSRGSICKSTQGFPQVCTGHFLHKGTWLRGVGAEIPPCSTLQPRPLLPPRGRPAFSTCIWAKGGPEILFFDPYPPRDPKVQYSSPHLQHYGCFLKEEDMPKVKVNSFWRYIFCSVREEEKKRESRGIKEEWRRGCPSA